MTKFKVTQDLDYISGHLRYGHFEGIIEYEVDAWDEGDNPIKMEEIE